MKWIEKGLKQGDNYNTILVKRTNKQLIEKHQKTIKALKEGQSQLESDLKYIKIDIDKLEKEIKEYQNAE